MAPARWARRVARGGVFDGLVDESLDGSDRFCTDIGLDDLQIPGGVATQLHVGATERRQHQLRIRACFRVGSASRGGVLRGSHTRRLTDRSRGRTREPARAPGPAEGPASPALLVPNGTGQGDASLRCRIVETASEGVGVQVRVLGTIEVSDHSGDRPLPPQARRLLGLLIAQGASVLTLSVLAEELGAADPLSVRMAVSRLRKVMGGRIRTADHGYRLVWEQDDALDAACFEQLVAQAGADPAPRARSDLLREALDLWRGPAYAGLDDSPTVQPVAARLCELRAGAIELLGETLLELGRFEETVLLLEDHHDELSFRERPVAVTMRALTAAGRVTDALRVYRRFRMELRDEIGVMPSRLLRDLEAQLLADAASDTDVAPSARRPPAPTPPSGVVTFLFTNVEDANLLWERVPRSAINALARHDDIVRTVVAAHGGHVFAAGTDRLAAGFASAPAAGAAAAKIQVAIAEESWPEGCDVKVRIGLHTGPAQLHDDSYLGTTVTRAARIAESGHGGQVVVSATTSALLVEAGRRLAEVGLRRLEPFGHPEPLYRLQIPGLRDVDLPLRTDVDVGNLPRRRMALVGRQREVDLLASMLRPGSLTSVTGVGGVGKTRLALAAAQQAAPRFRDGAWSVELGSVVSPSDVAPAIATSLGLRTFQDLPALAAIVTVLDAQQRLILLDNCEHVLDAIAEVTEQIAERCPDVAVLTTTREALGLPEERVVALRPLALHSAAGRSDAATLFCERAHAAAGEFDPTANDELVERICRRLDGLPLAIELAAARLAMMSLEELDKRLDERFRLLTRRRGAVERHQSLRTTIAWSYDHLEPAEQYVFERLSVFAGGFDLAAADAVVGETPGGAAIDDVIDSLVTKSLLNRQHDSAPARFQQLETLREYGEERLEARGTSLDTRRRHLAHYVSWAKQADEGLKSADEPRWQRAFQAEWHNLRNALGWACETNDADAAVALVRHTLWWTVTRVRAETTEWLDAILALPSMADHPGRPLVLIAASFFAYIRGNRHPAGEDLLTAATVQEQRLGPDPEPWIPVLATFIHNPYDSLLDTLETQRRATTPFWRQCGMSQESMARAILLHTNAHTEDDRAAAICRIREVLHAAEHFGNTSALSHTIMALGVAVSDDDPDAAIALLERALELAVAVDVEVSTAQNRVYLATLYTTVGRPVDALRLLQPAIPRHIQAGSHAWAWWQITITALAFAELGDLHRAAEIFGAVDTIYYPHDERSPELKRLDEALSRSDLAAIRLAGRRHSLTAIAAHIHQAIDALTAADHSTAATTHQMAAVPDR
jgi:predicted ATPase/class 3 adenylate cyclase